jgi:hypothetical protein
MCVGFDALDFRVQSLGHHVGDTIFKFFSNFSKCCLSICAISASGLSRLRLTQPNHCLKNRRAQPSPTPARYRGSYSAPRVFRTLDRLAPCQPSSISNLFSANFCSTVVINAIVFSTKKASARRLGTAGVFFRSSPNSPDVSHENPRISPYRTHGRRYP